MNFQVPPDPMLVAFEPVYREFIRRLLFVLRSEPAEPTSWWRSEAQNRAVGGATDSQHLFGFALDIVAARPDRIEQLAREAGLIAVVEMDHVHVQLFPAGFLRQFGLFDSGILV